MQDALPSAFLDRLWEIQGQRSLSDAALARRIGISQSYLIRIRNGERNKRPGGRVVLAILREFPELTPFLGTDLQIGEDILPMCNDEVAG
jgi:transcriptional regulator with XRE-family HTH domain